MCRKSRFNLFIVIIMCSLEGCLTPVKVAMVEKVYLDPKISVERGCPTGYTVALRDVECSKAIGNYVTHLKNANILYADEREQWAEHPSEVVFRVIYRTLKNTNRFADVADAVEIKNPDLIVFAKLKKFFIIEVSDKKEVVFSLEFTLRDVRSGRLIVEEEFEISEPIIKSSSNYVETMNQVLYKFSNKLSELINDLNL